MTENINTPSGKRLSKSVSEKKIAGTETPEFSQAAKSVITPSSQFTILWLLPLVALIFSIWIGWKLYIESSLLIDVQFSSGLGLDAGQTQVMYNGLAVGSVKKVQMLNDLSGVNVTLKMDRMMEPYINKNSAFWLVAPEVSLAKISGLETLLSGNYIGFQPGYKGLPKKKSFVAKKKPPAISEPGGLYLTLQTNELGSITQGSSVYYKKISVGEVIDYRLSSNNDLIDVNIIIKSQFAHLVTNNTKFWNASGVDVSGNMMNFKVRTQSVSSILRGGIAFFTPKEDLIAAGNNHTTPLEKNNIFTLYQDYDQAKVGIDISISFPMGVSLTKNFTKLKFFGLDMGVVRDIQIKNDLKTVVAKVSVNPTIENALVEGAKFWVVEPEISLSGLEGLDSLLQGSYIKLDVSDHSIKQNIAKKTFEGLTSRPSATSANYDDLKIVLESGSLQAINTGSPVLFKQIEIGQVLSYDLSEDAKQVKLFLSIDDKYKHLINKSSKFWIHSGFQVKGSLSGLSVNMGSLSSLIKGGISVITPDLLAKSVKNGQAFDLFDTKEEALEQGQIIQIVFPDAVGLEQGTPVIYKGLKIGQVKHVKLNAKKTASKETTDIDIIAKIFIAKPFRWLAHEGAQFWLVEPELGLARVSNLDTLLKGRYVSTQPAQKPGPLATHFKALSPSGPDKETVYSGLKIILTTDRLNSLKKGSPVLFREIPVGEITGYTLAETSDHVLIFANIEMRYANLVQKDSRFWNNSGIDIHFGLLSGATFKTSSVESLLAGGISFATPAKSEPVKKNHSFKLYDERETTWLEWKPIIKR